MTYWQTDRTAYERLRQSRIFFTCSHRKPLRDAVVFLFLLIVLCTLFSFPVTSTHAAEMPQRLAGRGVSVWRSPLGKSFPLLHRYVQPPTPYAAGHRGIDLKTQPGEKVQAPVGGIVTFSGEVVDREVLTLQVQENMLLTLEPLDSNLRPGTRVHGGEHLGSVSSGGHCANLCLHVGVRVDGAYVNPLRFFTGRAQLLPLGSL